MFSNRQRVWGGLFITLILIAVVIATATVGAEPQPIRFAVIGDYGSGDVGAMQVAALVAGWNPDFVVTVGDNNYPSGAAKTIDKNIGKQYSQFIGNYHGGYGVGSELNRFWPSIGNHDWKAMSCHKGQCRGPYLDYFTLPGNERYYDVDYGFLRLWILNSVGAEPDGIAADSIQAGWLRDGLQQSVDCWDIAVMHHAPFSSGKHGGSKKLQWPFADWGIDAVLAGHDHTYERLEAFGIPYYVNGLGGKSRYGFPSGPDLEEGVESITRYNANEGALLIEVTPETFVGRFITVDGVVRDEHHINQECEVE